MPENPINFVLIDCENVQPKDLKLLKDGPFRVKVFLGQNQTKIPVEWAAALQPLGKNADYIYLEGVGSNALDFHIAFYLGELSCQEPEAVFHIISKDKGFDPLIKHLQGKGVLVHRNACIADMSYFKRALPPTIESQIEAVVANLERRNSSRPGTLKALRNTMHVLFKKEASEEQLSTLIDHLCKQGIVKVEGTKVSYLVPARAG